MRRAGVDWAWIQANRSSTKGWAGATAAWAPIVATRLSAPVSGAASRALVNKRHSAAGWEAVDIPGAQSPGLRAVTIQAAPSIMTERSPGRVAKAARTASTARCRMSSG